MAESELEGLKYSITGDSSDALKQLKDLKESLIDLKKTVNDVTGIKKLTDQVDRLGDSFGIAAAKARMLNTQLEKMSKFQKQLSAITDLPKVEKPKQEETKPKEEEAVTPVPMDVTTNAKETAGFLDNLKSKLAEARVQATEFRSAFAEAHPVLAKFGHAVGSTLKNGLKGAALGMVEFTKLSASLPKYFTSSFVSKVQSVTGAVTGLFKRIGRMALYRLVRTGVSMITKALKEGKENLYQYSKLANGEFAQAMDSIATSNLKLKNSIGAAISPLLEAMAPAIEYVTAKVVELINRFNQLMSALTGKSFWTKATDYATEYKAGVSGAAKEMKKFLLGFDEINKLGGNKDSGSSGAATPDYGKMFEEVPIDKEISDFAKKIKEAFDKEDWHEVGKILGTKLNEIVDSVDWYGFGRKVGKKLNAGIEISYSFLRTVDFRGYGRHIAESLNGMIEEINWAELGGLMVRRITSILDLGIGFIGTFDWGQGARALCDGVKGIFDELTTWIGETDWSQAGRKIVNIISDIITNIDYIGLASSMFTFMGSAIRATWDLVTGALSEVWDGITGWWNDAINNGPYDNWFLNLCKAVGDAFVNIGKFVYDGIIKPFVDALDIDWESFKQFAVDVWNSIVEALKNAVGIFWNGLKSIFGWAFGWLFNGEKKDANLGIKTEVNHGKTITGSPVMSSMIVSGNASGTGNMTWNSKNNSSSPIVRQMWDSGSFNSKGTVSISSTSVSNSGMFNSLYNRGTASGTVNANVYSDLRTNSDMFENLYWWNESNATVTAGVSLYKENYYDFEDFVTGGMGTTIRVGIGLTHSEKAKGGAFYNNAWHDIPQYAGGTLRAGSAFIAGEAGPELVGHLGGRTEVLNKSQLAATMAASMNAVSGPMISAFNTTIMSATGNVINVLNKILRAVENIDSGNDESMSARDIDDALRYKSRREGIA